MTWAPNFKKGVDLPSWDWLPSFPAGLSYHGSSCSYDGSRYIYWVIQYGSASTSASTTQLWRFDTWTEGWQYLATTTSGNRGVDVSYDAVRNVVYLCHGAALSSWQCFNLNATPRTIANVACAAWALTTMTPVLPSAADYGGSFLSPDDLAVNGTPLQTRQSAAGSTATSIIETADPGTFLAGLAGCYVRFTTGALAGQRRLITAVPDPRTLTVSAFGSAPGANDTFVVEVPEGTAAGGSASTLVMTAAGWTPNKYANADVLIVSGTGSGQRRRIASNTADTLTLAAAVTGNPRTGDWTTIPDATSVFRIVPSSDFLYYMPGTTLNAIYRLDVAQGAGAAWTANLGAAPATLGGGGTLLFAPLDNPFALTLVRGAISAGLYEFAVGLGTWSTLTALWGSETITTGATVVYLAGRQRIAVAKEGQSRILAHNLATTMLEGVGTLPYAAPGLYEGKRGAFVRTADGVEWLYMLRAGGQEYFRVPLEWLV